ncbi:hypothetical protein HN011_002755, partial [Eciton burchellii]
EQSTPHRHLPGTLRGSLSHSHNHHHHNHSHRHEPPLSPSTYLAPPPPPPASSFITAQRGCALHSRYRFRKFSPDLARNMTQRDVISSQASHLSRM